MDSTARSVDYDTSFKLLRRHDSNDNDFCARRRFLEFALRKDGSGAMSVVVPRWRFNAVMVDDAPHHKGVYVLWADGTPLAVGHARGGADTIRSRLLAHLAHGAEAGLRQVTHYSWELCNDPLKREAQVAEALQLRRRERPQEPQPRVQPENEWSAHESS